MKRIAMTAALLFALAGCSGDRQESATEPTEAATSESQDSAEDDVRDVATEQADRFASKDFGGAWDLWSEKGQAAISRADYISLGKTCDFGGAPLKVSAVRLESDKEAVVRVGVGDFEQSYSVLLENGEWRWQPTDGAIDTYSKGLDAAIDDLKSQGGC